MNNDLRRIEIELKRDGSKGSSFLLFLVIACLGSFLAWAQFTELDKVTRGDGVLISEIENQMVQAPQGGTLVARHIEVGDQVKQGDLIFEVDAVDARTQYDQARQKLTLLDLQLQRFEAQSEQVPLLYDLDELNAEAQSFAIKELELFTALQSQLQSTLQILELRKTQKTNEIDLLEREKLSVERVILLIDQEISILEPLVKQGFSPETSLLALKREKETSFGRLEAIEGRISSANDALIELAEQSTLEIQNYSADALTEISNLEQRLSEVQLTLPSLEAGLGRTSIYAPTAGIVNQINFLTTNAVVRAGDVLTEIVPFGDDLIVEGKIDPKDIGEIRIGDIVKISLTAYDATKFGRLDGRVSKISADAIADQQTGLTAYNVSIFIESSLYEADGSVITLLPGMVAQIEVLTGKRTILDYIWQPLMKTRDQALRD